MTAEQWHECAEQCARRLIDYRSAPSLRSETRRVLKRVRALSLAMWRKYRDEEPKP
jgi:hypothetical protein